VDEDGIVADNDHVLTVKRIAERRRAQVVVICGKIEAEIAHLDTAENAKSSGSSGLAESGLNRLIRSGYRALGPCAPSLPPAREDRAGTVPWPR
jgi:ribosome-binding ATPase YchF (GTP1/OBG family)